MKVYGMKVVQTACKNEVALIKTRNLLFSIKHTRGRAASSTYSAHLSAPNCLVLCPPQLPFQILIKRFTFHNALLNEYPYNKGHILISPKRHVALLSDLTLEEKIELLHIIDIAVKALQSALNADGFNIGMNMGKAGGASIPQHLHIHVVPRYLEKNLNQSFTTTIGKTTVISWDMEKLVVLLRKHFDLHLNN